MTIAPLIAAVLTAAAVLVVDLVRPGRSGAGRRDRAHRPRTDGASTTLSVGAHGRRRHSAARTPSTRSTTFLDILFIAVIVMTIMFAPDYLLPRSLPVAEFAIVLIFAMSGAMLLAGSTDLLLLFLGLELMVLPGYLLAGYHKTDGYSTEGAIKYFLLGSFSSAIFLFGLAFVWGLTGTTLDHRARRHRRQARGDRGRGGAAVGRAGDGPRVPDDGGRLQDRRGAVPLLDAGRLPGLADADHGLPVGRAEDRGVRADPAAVRRRRSGRWRTSGCRSSSCWPP